MNTDQLFRKIYWSGHVLVKIYAVPAGKVLFA